MVKPYYRAQASREQVSAAREILEQGSLGNRGQFDGDNIQQLFGLQAQILVADILGTDRPEASNEWDGGVDVVYNGKKWDVKCVLRNVDVKTNWKCNVPEAQLQNHYEADGYIFASYNKRRGEFQFVGWTTKQEFLDKATRHAPGDTLERADGTKMTVEGMPLYDIKISRLNRIRTLEDLRGVGSE